MVYGAGFENQWAQALGGSNPSPSAKWEMAAPWQLWDKILIRVAEDENCWWQFEREKESGVSLSWGVE